MSLAFRALEENYFGLVQKSVRQHVPNPGETDFRGWEWRYAWAQSQSEAVLIWDTPDEMDEVNNGTLKVAYINIFMFLVKYIAPIAIALVFLNGLGILTF